MGMIKLKNILNEKAYVSVNNIPAKFTVIAKPGSMNNIIQFIAASSNDLDKLQDVSRDDISAAILKYANKQFKEIKFISLGRDYQGAGYAIKIDLNTVVKKLN
jgi:hypothetical protein|tara:strand:+ start:193 stop:501 length:309 start_codon:yes stop_codon:yes gene_type:complete